MAVTEFKCPNCDGGVNFDSASQQMKCPFCMSTFDVDALNSLKDCIGEEKDNVEWPTHDDAEWVSGEQEGMRLYSCNSCAGEIIADATTGATSCPFCGNPVIMKGNFSGCAKPDCIIPFKLDRKMAIDALTKHLSGRRLLPQSFKSSKRLGEIKGVYVPFWLFNAEVEANMRYKATITRSWSDQQFNYTENRHFNVTRHGQLAFDNVPVDASSKMPDDLMESLEPFDAKAAVDFKVAFLSGYMADKFDFSSEDSVERANRRIKKSTEDAFIKTVTGYNSVKTEHCGISLTNSTVKYALMPVWVLNATWQGKNYLFAMNGQTGKFVGDLPTDWGIFKRWFIIFTAIFAVLTFVILLAMGVA